MTKFTFDLHPGRLGKLSERDQADLIFDLINAFAVVKGPVESSLLLQDLLTASEIRYLSKRLRIAKLLMAGKTHGEIVHELKCSFGTVAKISGWLDEAGDGFKRVVRQLPERKKPFKFKRGYYGYGLPQILIGSILSVLHDQERKRLKKFLSNTKSKKKIYDEIQKTINRQFKKR